MYSLVTYIFVYIIVYIKCHPWITTPQTVFYKELILSQTSFCPAKISLFSSMMLHVGIFDHNFLTFMIFTLTFFQSLSLGMVRQSSLLSWFSLLSLNLSCLLVLSFVLWCCGVLVLSILCFNLVRRLLLFSIYHFDLGWRILFIFFKI